MSVSPVLKPSCDAILTGHYTTALPLRARQSIRSDFRNHQGHRLLLLLESYALTGLTRFIDDLILSAPGVHHGCHFLNANPLWMRSSSLLISSMTAWSGGRDSLPASNRRWNFIFRLALALRR